MRARKTNLAIIQTQDILSQTFGLCALCTRSSCQESLTPVDTRQVQLRSAWERLSSYQSCCLVRPWFQGTSATAAKGDRTIFALYFDTQDVCKGSQRSVTRGKTIRVCPCEHGLVGNKRHGDVDASLGLVELDGAIAVCDTVRLLRYKGLGRIPMAFVCHSFCLCVGLQFGFPSLTRVCFYIVRFCITNTAGLSSFEEDS